jgi:hypothetical protein
LQFEILEKHPPVALAAQGRCLQVKGQGVTLAWVGIEWVFKLLPPRPI